MIETIAMAGSKLEQFRDAHFPDGDDEDAGRPSEQRAPHSRSKRTRSEKARRPLRRGGFGRVYLGFKIFAMLGPLAFLILSTVAECGSRPSWMMPEWVRATACARRDLTRHTLSIETTLKTVSERLR